MWAFKWRFCAGNRATNANGGGIYGSSFTNLWLVWQKPLLILQATPHILMVAAFWCKQRNKIFAQTTVETNTSQAGSGGIYFSDGFMEMCNCQVKSAKVNGAVLFAQRRNSISNMQFVNNTLNNPNGGALYLNNADATIDNSLHIFLTTLRRMGRWRHL